MSVVTADSASVGSVQSSGIQSNGPSMKDQNYGPQMKFSVKHAFGSHAPKIDPLLSFASSSGNKDYSDRLIYKVGKHVCVHDPETNNQEFFDSRAKNVIDVVHFSLSANNRYIAMCEITRNERGSNDSSLSQVSVYSLSKMTRLKTMHHTLPKPFVCSTFCGDPKLLAAMSDEPDRHIVIWYWEKEKVYKTVSIAMIGANLLRSAPSNSLMLTTSGPAALKNWCIAPDGSLKPSNFIPPAKESLDVYLDHIWLPSYLNQHRMIALVDPDATNEMIKHRRQTVYVFEGLDNVNNITQGSIAPILPILMELKQSIVIKNVDVGVRFEKIIPNAKAFLLVGLFGTICLFERTDDKLEPYIETRRFSIGDVHLTGATVYPSEERMILLTKSGRMLSMAMDITSEQLKKGLGLHDIHNEESQQSHNRSHSNKRQLINDAAGAEETTSASHKGMKIHSESSTKHHGIQDLTSGGFHTSTILAMDIAYERPLIATLGGDGILRVWNYLTGKCELLHHFKSDEPLTCAFATNGFQLLISFKDRIRLYNVLMDKIKLFRETVLKNCKVLKFSNGGQYFAAASAINVMIYDTKTFQQVSTFQGHMMTVVKLTWSPGDQVLFSAGLDGNVYGWPIFREGKIEVITANNRSSAILDIVTDCLSTVFPNPAMIAQEEEMLRMVLKTGGNSGNNSGGNSLEGSNLNPINTSNNTIAASILRSWMIVSSLDGHLRMPGWSLDSIKSNNPNATNTSITSMNTSNTSNASLQQALNKQYPMFDGIPVVYGDASVSITSMQLSVDRTKLFVGTSIGSIRMYPWPPDPNCIPAHPPAHHSLSATPHHANTTVSHHAHNTASLLPPHTPATSSSTVVLPTAMYLTHATCSFEIFPHAGSVVGIKLSPLDNTIISAATDGSVFVHTFSDERPNNPVKRASITASLPSNSAAGLVAGLSNFESLISDALLDEEEKIVFNSDVVLLAQEDVEDHVNAVVELQKLLAETKAKNDFQARKLELEHNESLKRISEMHEMTLAHEKEGFDKSRHSFEKRIRELMSSMESKENDHVKIITELENKYEHKLADQLERYDMLSEKMTLLKQKCEGLLENEKLNFIKQINDIKQESNQREKRLRIDNRRAIEDKQSNEDAFKEIINQQEDEYEEELKSLIKAAESELGTERDTIVKLRTLVQTKNTKLDQLKKKFVELQTASKARMLLLNQEKTEKTKLMNIIEHYKQNLQEREDALAEKEKLVLELRSKTRTLENFRFVLDHRLQQLSAERGPITSHIEGLEKHISTMYEELVEEFSLKKTVTEQIAQKDMKITLLTQDIRHLRNATNDKDSYIEQFKRELSNIVSSMVMGKELEECIKGLYRKFVRNEMNGLGTRGMAPAVKVSPQVNGAVHELMANANNKDTKGKSRYGTGGNLGGTLTNTTDINNNNLNVSNDDQSFMSNDQNDVMGLKHLAEEVEEALVDSAKEADRQKKFVEKQSSNLKHRLIVKERESMITSRRRLHENSDLLYECNELRIENKDLTRAYQVLQHDYEELNRLQKNTQKQLDTLAITTATGGGGGGGGIGGGLGGYVMSNNKYAGVLDDELGSVSRGITPTTAQPVSQGLNGQQEVTTNGEEVAPWIVHNSLPLGGGNSPSRPTTGMEDVMGIAGKPVTPGALPSSSSSQPNKPPTNSYSMPNLHPEHTPNNSGKMKLSQTMQHPQPQAITTTNTNNRNKQKIVAITMPRTVSAPSIATNTTNTNTNNMSSIHVNHALEKYQSEIDYLSQKLEEREREKEMQKLEISRLRKQLTASLTAENNSNGNGMLPSIQHSRPNSVPGTHADLYGFPSNDELKDMRVGPQGSVISATSLRTTSTLASGSNHSLGNKKKAISGTAAATGAVGGISKRLGSLDLSLSSQ